MGTDVRTDAADASHACYIAAAAVTAGTAAAAGDMGATSLRSRVWAPRTREQHMLLHTLHRELAKLDYGRCVSVMNDLCLQIYAEWSYCF